MSTESESSEYSFNSYNDEESKYNEEYKFECTNLDPSLARLVGLDIKDKSVENNWIPPKFSGLDNSSKIQNGKFIDFDSITTKITRKQKLSQEELIFLESVSEYKKNIIIQLYNSVI